MERLEGKVLTASLLLIRLQLELNKMMDAKSRRGADFIFLQLSQGKLDIGIYNEPIHLWSTLADAYGMDLNVTVPIPKLNYTPIGPIDFFSDYYNQKVCYYGNDKFAFV